MRTALALVAVALTAANAAAAGGIWSGYGRDAQHSAIAPAPAQPLAQIHWSTPVDLDPQYSGDALLIHYGSPLVTRDDIVIVTVKTGATDGFRFEARRADTGTTLWTLATDYTLPAHNWVPSVGPAVARSRLFVPAAGGTVLRRNQLRRASAPVRRLAFYGAAAHDADPASFDATVWISTPLTADAHGNLYFGFIAVDGAPAGLESGVARLTPSGHGTWTAASAAAVDASIVKVVTGSAPALSADGRRLYVVVADGSAAGYLVALDARTLAPLARVRLVDVAFPANAAILSDNGTASPTVGPDGDVYIGVLERPFPSHHDRGWLLHFDATLSTTKTPGSFGWDDTPSIVPTAAVPSYAGTSSYLLLTKYNDYAGIGGDGVNRIAVLDPNATMTDPISGATVMREVLTIAGPTPDPEHRDAAHPSAVTEWCVNTAAIDVAGRSALVNNEDGVLYRWDFTTNTLAEHVILTGGLGEAYTPTVVGPDGTVYAIGNATLFAVGAAP